MKENIKKIIKVIIDLGLAFLLLKLKPVDTYSYVIGLITMLIWDTSDLIFKRYFK